MFVSHALCQDVLRTTAKVNAIQCKRVIFDANCPLNPKPMATKFGMGNEVGTPTPVQNFYHYPIRGFRSAPPPLSCSVRGRVLPLL